jgi:hypothetical protein
MIMEEQAGSIVPTWVQEMINICVYFLNPEIQVPAMPFEVFQVKWQAEGGEEEGEEEEVQQGEEEKEEEWV